MRLVPFLITVGGLLTTPAYADPGDAVSWLQRIAVAAQNLNFTGTFSYQTAAGAETSRITHLFDASGEHERIEVLDGSLRELVRSNDEVKCYLPDDKLIIVENRRQYKSFPALLPSAVGGLGEYYQIRKGETARVAGFESQIIILEPRDQLRYGHLLWAEIESGLLLKARTFNERNEPIEQFAFTQVQIGGTIDRASLRPKTNTANAEWRVQNARTAPARPAGGEWLFKSPPPGFKMSAGMKRRGANPGQETTHFVFSDGLASISVFIEPTAEPQAAGKDDAFTVGAISSYKRLLGRYQLTVLGEVPHATLKRLADGVERRGR